MRKNDFKQNVRNEISEINNKGGTQRPLILDIRQMGAKC